MSSPGSSLLRSLSSRARQLASRGPAAGEVLRIGLIGCGERGASYPQAIAKSGNAKLTMVADLNGELAEELGERLGLPWATTLDDLLGGEIDAVLICTPHHVHATQVTEAARRGKHVMVEKPLATSMADAAAAVEAAQASNVFLSVVLQTRYQPQIQKARELVRAGALGRLLGTSLAYQHDKLLGYWFGGYTGRSRSDWRARPETSGGGVLIQSAIHHLDWLTYLTGERIVEVSAQQATLDSPAEVEDTIAGWMRYENGAIGSLSAATCVRGSEHLGHVELWGTDGQISLVPPHRFYSLRIVDGQRPGRWHTLGSPPSGSSDSTGFFREFAKDALAGGDAAGSADEALRLQATVDAFYKSANSGKTVTVDDLL
jgi:predicted dehydrogenase